MARDGKLNNKGLPSLLQLAVMVPHFGDEIRLTSPPWAVQRALFAVLTPIGRALGYRAEYPYAGRGEEPPMAAGVRASKGTMRIAAIIGVFLVFWLLWQRRDRSRRR